MVAVLNVWNEEEVRELRTLNIDEFAPQNPQSIMSVPIPTQGELFRVLLILKLKKCSSEFKQRHCTCDLLYSEQQAEAKKTTCFAFAGTTGFIDVPSNNYPFYSAVEKYRPVMQQDGGQLSGSPSPSQQFSILL